jgi:Glycosyl hydrolase family 47
VVCNEHDIHIDIWCTPACSGAPYHKMDHLACFTPGMLALGAKYGAVTGAKAELYMQLGRNLTETCYQMYARQPTGASTPPHAADAAR